jgi:hypothetical protein|uniref:Uncharacterized protein n=1 Tax=Oryza rufipogon TaxID=4529 RepID=A0A0E0Q5X4_ORYRU
MSASPLFSFLVLFQPVLPHRAARQRVQRLSPPPFRLHVQGDVPQLKEICSSLATSKELVKALVGIWGPDDGLNPSTASLLSALCAELDLARAHVRHLATEDRRHGDETARMRTQLVEEAREWRSQQREKVAAMVRVAAAELDGEQRSRRRAERVNAKLGKALADAERELAASRRELERERRSRERLEKVCDKLVRGGLACGVDDVRGGEEEVRREAQRGAGGAGEREGDAAPRRRAPQAFRCAATKAFPPAAPLTATPSSRSRPRCCHLRRHGGTADQLR